MASLTSAPPPNPTEQIYLKSLSDNSSTPIDQVIYFPTAKLYTSILKSNIRNLIFASDSTPRPLFIVAPTHLSHIQSTILCCKTHSLQLRIRSGGHDYDGLSHDYEGVSYVSNSPFFILDMFNLRGIQIDAADQSGWVQAGATLGELYYAISRKSNLLAFPAGVCPTVGVGGHLSGGGYGNLLRKYGLSVDHIVDAQIVDANGKFLDSKAAMGEDLFWAIRGGGGASFGVVITYKIKLVPVPATVTVFRVEKYLEQNATDMVYQWQFVAPKTTNDLFMRMLLQPVSSKTKKGSLTTASIQSLYLGKADEVVSLLNKDFPELGLTREDCKEMSWIDSVLWYGTADYGKSPDALLNRYTNSPSHPAKSAKRKSDFVVNRVSREGLDRIMNRLVEFSKIRMTFSPYGGEMNEISCAKTPFPHRKGNLYMIEYVGNWVGNDEGMVNELRSMYDYMAEFVSRNPRRAYLNYRDLDIGTMEAGDGYEQGRVYGMKYFSGNFDRLVRVKTEVDPGNFFSSVQSVPTLRRKV
ncbi:Berberine bridge enzyme-like 2 [Linum grandiflorum]